MNDWKVINSVILIFNRQHFFEITSVVDQATPLPKPVGNRFQQIFPQRSKASSRSKDFEKPVSGLIYRTDQPPTSGMPLVVIDTSLVDPGCNSTLGFFTFLTRRPHAADRWICPSLAPVENRIRVLTVQNEDHEHDRSARSHCAWTATKAMSCMS